jgi:uncharacterized protein YjbJ (UPF0337 family)
MNWDRIKGSWTENKGLVKQKWADLTDDDMLAIEGNKDELVGRLQQRYGLAKDKAKQEVDDWLDAA